MHKIHFLLATRVVADRFVETGVRHHQGRPSPLGRFREAFQKLSKRQAYLQGDSSIMPRDFEVGRLGRRTLAAPPPQFSPL